MKESFEENDLNDKSSSSESWADEQVPYDKSSDSDIKTTEDPQNTQNQRREQSCCTICLEKGKLGEVIFAPNHNCNSNLCYRLFIL